MYIGTYAGCKSSSGVANMGIGMWAGRNITSGFQNVIIGRRAGTYITTGNNNTLVGNYAGSGASFDGFTGTCNVFLGAAGGCISTGSCNIGIGNAAGRCVSTGCNNIFVGTYSGCGATAGLANITTESNRIIMGNNSHACAQIKVAWTVVSDCRDKCIFGKVPRGRGFLEKLEPIEYAFKDRETNEITDPPGKKRYGFSAQDILELEGDDKVLVSDEFPEKLNLTQDYMIPILVNAFKELSEDVENLKKELAALKNQK
jgi:hypothetical protein